MSRLLRLHIAQLKPEQSQYKAYDITYYPVEPVWIEVPVEVSEDGQVDVNELIEAMGQIGLVTYEQSLLDASERDDIRSKGI